MKQADKTELLNLACVALTAALKNMEPERAIQYAQIVAMLDALPVDADATPDAKAARCSRVVHIATIGAAACECGARKYNAAEATEHKRTADESPYRARIAPTPVPETLPMAKTVSPDAGLVQGITFAKPVSEARANAAMDALSKPMLLDGPVPTPAQVACIRNAALEAAAALCGREHVDATAAASAGRASFAYWDARGSQAWDLAKAIRAMKTPEPK